MNGQIIGNYEILEELGRGGMGIVYRAHDRELHREVAVKVLTPDLAADPIVGQRFIREARAAAQLSHDAIVRVYDVGQYGDCRLIAMEYVPGKTLAQTIRETGPLPVKQALYIALRVAEALAAAHEKGIVHRDIKPQNIMVCPDGRVKVLDFGLAKVRDGLAHLTVTGAFVGTPMYMSPEQCRGQSVDARTDLYSLGVTLFEMLAGSPPFEAATPMAVMYQILNKPLPKIADLRPNVPRALQETIGKMTAKNPEERFDSDQHLVDALRADVRWGRANVSVSGMWRNVRTRWLAVLSGVGGGLLIVAAILVYLVPGPPARVAVTKVADSNPYTPAGGNLIDNPSFEIVENEMPASWRHLHWSGSPVWKLSEDSHSGRYSVSVSAPEAADAGWETSIAVFPNINYKLTGWIKTENVTLRGGARGAVLDVYTVGHGGTKPVVGTSDWTKVETTFNSGDNTKLTIQCQLGNAGQATGTAWFDDLILIATL